MRVYLAAPYDSRDMIRGYREEMINRVRHRFTCTSSWLNEAHEINAGTTKAAPALSDEQVNEHVKSDLLDVAGSDAFVLFTSDYVGFPGGGGRHVEMGFALANLIPVIVIGEPENIFQRYELVERVDDWEAAMAVLQTMALDLAGAS